MRMILQSVAGRLAGWQAGRLASWQAGRLASWQAGKLAGWQAGRLASWKAGKLAGWQAGKQKKYPKYSLGCENFSAFFSQQPAKILVGQSRVPNNVPHRDGIHRIMSWYRYNAVSIRHHNMLPLPGNPETYFLQGAYSIQMIDSRQLRHNYAARTSTSRVIFPRARSSTTRRYSDMA